MEHAEKWANQGKVVIIAALDGDFQRQPFGSILSLIPLAETVIKLSAVCTRCRKDAAFTRRLGTETTVEVQKSVWQKCDCFITMFSRCPTVFLKDLTVRRVESSVT